MIELRSDTFTLPTEAMIKAMATARLGNDGYREDPTVIELEQLAARKLDKAAACFLPSGTMANLACILAHCRQRDNVVFVGDRSDIFVYESAGAALCNRFEYISVPTQPDGTFGMDDLQFRYDLARAVRNRNVAVLCVENPHNLHGGVVLPESYIRTIAGFAHARGIQVHLDGARIFNAAVASNIEAADIARFADSVQFCLSKGLAAPVGSLAVGEAEFIERVRGFRKVLGGTMRQAGCIAAAGIVALEQMVERLSDDHIHARRLAEGLAKIPGIKLDLNTVQTNLVVFETTDQRFTCESLIASAHHCGINLSEFKYGRIRAVTHVGTTTEQIDKALDILAWLMKEGPVEGVAYCAEVHG